MMKFAEVRLLKSSSFWEGYKIVEINAVDARPGMTAGLYVYLENFTQIISNKKHILVFWGQQP